MTYQFHTTTQRSNMMKKIKSTNTEPEKRLCQLLWHHGVRYRKNYKSLPGKPDIAIVSQKIAIFVDGEFWHGYHWDEKRSKIKANRDYWIPKIEKNIARDKSYTETIRDMGWKVFRFWERDIEKHPEDCLKMVLDTIHLHNDCKKG